jgi:uncharacterized protein
MRPRWRASGRTMSIPVEPLKPRNLGLRGFSLLANWASRRPRTALVLAALLTLAAAPGLLRLKLRTDGHALVSANAPEVIYDQAIRDQFGIADQIVVLIRSSHADGIFNPETLALVRELTAALGRLPGMQPGQIVSLATESGFRLDPKTYNVQPLLPLTLSNAADLARLRDDLRRIELYSGTLVSADASATLILVSLPNGMDRGPILEQVRQISAARENPRHEIAVTGAPVAEALLGTQILEDLGVPGALLGSRTAETRNPGSWQAPANWHELRLFMTRRIGLVPMAALVMMLVFLACFRSLLAALLPLPGVVATMLFVFGWMGWCGVPVYLSTAVMPVLLTVISVTNDIYLFSRYFILRREQPGQAPGDLVLETFNRLGRPVVCTSLTTVLGFLSFGLSPLASVRAFGIFTGIGALFGLLLSLTVVPALLVLLSPAGLRPPVRHTRPTVTAWLAAGFGRLGPLVVRRRWWLAGLTLAVLALTPDGLRRLAVQDSWNSGFAPESEFRRATRLVNDQFHGTHLLLVSLEAPQRVAGEIPASSVDARGIVLPTNGLESLTLVENSPISVRVAGDLPTDSATNHDRAARWRTRVEHAFQRGAAIHARLGPEPAPAEFLANLRQAGVGRFEINIPSHLQPELLRTAADLGQFIRQRRELAVGGVLGPADYLLTTRFMSRPDDPQARQLPASAAEAKLLWHYFEVVRGPQRLREVVDTNYSRSLTTVFLKDANFVDTARLMQEIRGYEQEHLAPQGIKLGFAGDVAVSQSLIRGIVTTQMQSLFWSLAGIFVVTAWFGGTLRWGLYCLLPSALAVVFKFAVMGWLDIPLGVATSMFAAMTLGIGVNCAIHLLEACRQARGLGATPPEALRQALEWTGPPALINTLAMSLGFGVLMLSQVPANARLGTLLVLGLVNCFVVSLLLLPVLLNWWPLPERPRTDDSAQNLCKAGPCLSYS